MPSPELNYAINHTALSRLQNVLRRVCDASPTAQALVEEELLAPSASTNVIDLTADEINRPVQPATCTSSVKRQRHAMCNNCKEEFDVTENAEDSCEYHKGTLEIYWDDDFWADHDEDCHGTIDLDLVDDCPEGFRWSCCNGPGDEEACTIGPHKLDEKFKPEVKKRRIWE
ncbi:hypothetical protein E4T44_06546 [Aureobasidium sp. EXF-8845]|nr:hypothetical protein E4T45_10550 [Aureobasidium sp. EXF-8846]KAI4843806.1 hypothetical protein E4T44_06546 [Aureobasidium sp. EXF-8845]